MKFLLWAIAIILSAAAGYWVYRVDAKRGTPKPWLTALLRTIVIFLTLLLILAPVITITNNETQKPVILFVQDNSSSIAAALDQDSIKYKNDAAALMQKLSGNYKVVTWNLDGNTPQDSIFNYIKPATDLSKTLSGIQEYYNAQNLGAIILATDGRYNQGNNPLYQQLSLQSPLYTVGIGDSSRQKDIRIAQAYHNKTISLNSTFEIRADIIAAMCRGYNNTVTLSENGNTIGSSPVSVISDRFDRSVSFTVKADKAGIHHYVLSAPIAEGEKNTSNNRKDIFIEVVDEKKNILIAAAAPHPDVKAIKQALDGVESYKITVRMGNELPSFSEYSVIILHQLPSPLMNIQRDIITAKKPVWYILGGQSSIPALQSMPTPTGVNINSVIVPRDLYPAFNLSFNSFTVPQNLQTVMDKMPPLTVPVGSAQATPDADVLFQQRDADKTALWALLHNNTSTAVTTGEGIWRWRMYEYKNFNTHNTIDECIRQTVAFLAANSSEKPFYVSLPKYVWSDQENVSLNAYLLNKTNQQVNTADVQLIIKDSAGKKQNFSFERSSSSYKLNSGIWPAGSYTYSAQANLNGTTYTANGSFVIEHTPLEQMESGADFNLLYSLSKKYNGCLVPASNISSLADSIAKNNTIKPVIQSNTQSVPLVDWKWYFLLILLFATAEWLLRKYWLAQ